MTGRTLLMLFWIATTLHLGAGSLHDPTPQAEFLEAAQRGDLARVQALLEAGVDVDSKNRYGASALTFATEKRRIEVVRFLLKSGADVNVRDTFYHQTPLSWSLDNQSHDISILLLEHGCEEVAMALMYGVREKNLPLVKAALARGPLPDFEIETALEIARNQDSKLIAQLLEGSERKETAYIQLSPDRLNRFVGSYATASATHMSLFVSWPLPRRIGLGLMQHVIAGEQSGQIEVGSHKLEIGLSGGGLSVRSSQLQEFKLKPISPTEFRSPQDPRLGVAFFGRTGMTEGLVLAQGSVPTVFSRRIAEGSMRRSTESPAEGIDLDDAPALAQAPRSSPLNWASFRGDNASGVGDGQGIPTTWDVEKGSNLRWTAEIPGLAHSSPIVWGDRVFLTTAVSGAEKDFLSTGFYGSFDSVRESTEHSWRVYCLDKASGRILWQREAGRQAPLSGRHSKATQANSTPVADGTRVIAVFPTVGMVCYDFQGRLLWKRDLGALDSGWFYDSSYEWGFASSPIIHKGRVILQADIRKNAYIAAWDLETGKLAWKTKRDEIPTWSTPAVLSSPGGDELITNGTAIRAYDPASGAELWNLRPNSEVIIATPVVGDDLVYVSGGYPPTRTIYAIRPGGRGDISLAQGESSSDRIAWSTYRTGSYITTPLLYRGMLYLIHHNGRLSAFDAVSGRRIYRARVGHWGTFTGSPVAADGRIYLATEEGAVHVVKAGPDFQELAANDMGESLLATPAISDGMIFIRGRTRLFAIGAGPQAD